MTLDSEDQKIVTLARATRARAGSDAGAAVRDTDGRTYAAAAVDLPSLQISALRLAVAMAASSGVTGLEAAAVVSSGDVTDDDVAAVRDLGGTGLRVFVADDDGSVTATLAS
ncbi:MAG: cytidine deaminase [Propionibacteriales bacterium]|nr:cytidine deaminase [Propionibacteriales bacterium]